jgi:hypothetical protein
VAGAGLIAYLIAMSRGLSIAPSLQRELLEYKNFPTWMYSEPHNILGLEPSPFGDAAPMTVIIKAWRLFNIRFHPDNGNINGFPSLGAAGAAHRVGIEAHEAFVQYYENPYCVNNTKFPKDFRAPHDALGIPHFAKNCTCTAWRQALGATTSALLEGTVLPNSSASHPSFSTICPCTSDIVRAFRNARAHVVDSVPPPLARIWDATPWVTLSPRVFKWKVSTMFRGTNMHCIQPEDEKTRWEKDGWAVEQDWDFPWDRVCAT